MTALDFGAVVMPIDLVRKIMKRTETNGSLGGVLMESENLYVVTSAAVGGEELESILANRLRSHAAFRDGNDQPRQHLLLWSRVEKGFREQIETSGETNRANVEAALHQKLKDGISAICTMEPSEKSSDPDVRPYLFFSKDDVVLSMAIDLKLLYRSAPFVTLPEASTKVLSTKHVLVVGVGSGGSEIALDLGCAGVGSLTLIDRDRLEPANYIRHVLDRRDLGRAKVYAMRDEFTERELPTQISAKFLDVLSSADDFRASLSNPRPDLIICATDSRESRRFVNYCAVLSRIPLVIAGILDDGRVGEILHVEPGRTACYECVRLELGATLEAPATGERTHTPYVGGEAQNLQLAVHRSDVGFVASLAARVALSVLDTSTFEALPSSYIVWGRERTEHSAPFSFELPLSLNYVSISKRLDCPVCGRASSENLVTDVDEQFKRIIADLSTISG